MDKTLYNLGEVFKDNWDYHMPWRVQMSKGRLPCKTKREALRIGNAIVETIRELRSRELE